jgi:hypothetical protein
MNKTPDLAQTFESLRAEVEAPWLGQAFLPPREFGLMTGSNSILVMGEEGSGKTALEIQLKTHAAQKKSPHLLAASWRPQLLGETASSDQVAESFMSQAMDSLSFAFLQTIVCTPSIYSSAVPWARDYMLWFIQRFLQGDREFHLSRLAEQADPHGLETVTRLLSDTPRSLFPQSTPASVLPHLTEAVKALGFEGIWIFVDNLDTLFRLNPARMEQFLNNFLSTLEYFEDPAFSFKIIVSRELGLRLQTARGVITRRFKTYNLTWQEEELIRIIEKRIAIMPKRENVLLGNLCKDNAWLQWLKQYAGVSPRGWLDLTRPVLVAFIKKRKSLSKTEWLDIYRKEPPLLRLDLEAGHAFIGYGKLDVSAIGYKLLAYLYQNRHRSCTKSELYYCAHKELAKEPRTKEDAGWEDVSSWEGMMDTALWRLRQVVEWDKDESTPIYVISERGQGKIRLENTA